MCNKFPAILVLLVMMIGCNSSDYQSANNDVADPRRTEERSRAVSPFQRTDDTERRQEPAFDLFAEEEEEESEPRVLTDKEIRQPSPVPSLFEDGKVPEAQSQNHFSESNSQTSETEKAADNNSESESPLRPLSGKMDSTNFQNRRKKTDAQAPQTKAAPMMAKGGGRYSPENSTAGQPDSVNRNAENDPTGKKDGFFGDDGQSLFADDSPPTDSTKTNYLDSDFREFVDRTGKSKKWARLLRVDTSSILISDAAGSKFRIAKSELSDNDKAYLDSLAPAKSTKRESREFVFDEQVRTFTDGQGDYFVEAKIESYQAGEARLRKSDGKLVKIQVRKLSKEDQKYVNRLIRLAKSSDK